MTFVPPVVAGCEDRSALTVSAISTAILLPLSRPCAMCRGSTRLCFLRSVIIFNGQDLSAMGLHVCIYIYIFVCVGLEFFLRVYSSVSMIYFL